MSRSVEIWNRIPGQIPMKKFQDRTKRSLGFRTRSSSLKTATKQAKKTALDQQRALKKPDGKEQPSERSNRKAEGTALMKRKKGVTVAEISEVTQWQAHTVRGFVSILGSKGGFTIESSKNPSDNPTVF